MSESDKTAFENKMKKRHDLMAGSISVRGRTLMALAVFGAAVLPLAASGAAKPVALVGLASEGVAFQHDLLAGERIRAVRHFGKDNPLAAADYRKYSLLFFSGAENTAQGLESYAADGGILVVSR